MNAQMHLRTHKDTSTGTHTKYIKTLLWERGRERDKERERERDKQEVAKSRQEADR